MTDSTVNPINELLQHRMYEPWDVPTQYKLRNEIVALGIPGLVDVQFDLSDRRSVRVIPVFATEQDYVWYNLKYGN
jgi:hypothetical protein